MFRYKLTIMYDGANFCGYQVQPNKRTVQGELETALEFLLKTPVKTYASGRTDAGVSALGQVVHFDSNVKLDAKKLQAGLNAKLTDIAVTEAKEVSLDFDARFSVKQKTYQYLFYVSRFTLPLYVGRAVRINDYADIKLMDKAAKLFIGTHDFKSFVARKSGKTDFVRTIYDAKIVKITSDLYAFEITGDGFLYNMVRIIFGTLVSVAYGKIKPEQITSIIEAKDRSKAGKTYGAEALYLKNVKYTK